MPAGSLRTWTTAGAMNAWSAGLSSIWHASSTQTWITRSARKWGGVDGPERSHVAVYRSARLGSVPWAPPSVNTVSEERRHSPV